MQATVFSTLIANVSALNWVLNLSTLLKCRV